MKCPIDTDTDLVMTERSGIEIDYCPTCRGVWLDRGELDKIIDRSLATSSPAAPPPVPPVPAAPAPAPAPERPWHERGDRDRDWDDDDWGRRRDWDDDDWKKYRKTDGYKKKRKSSILGEIFDF